MNYPHIDKGPTRYDLPAEPRYGWNWNGVIMIALILASGATVCMCGVAAALWVGYP